MIGNRMIRAYFGFRDFPAKAITATKSFGNIYGDLASQLRINYPAMLIDF